MSDNASIARPYAKAIFELAREDDGYEVWTQALNQIRLICEDETFAALNADPRVDRNRVTDLLIDLCRDKLPAGGTNLIKLLVQNHRLSIIADIETQYATMVAQAQQQVTAEVMTAFALTEAQRTSLANALESRLGLKVNLQEVVDRELIGGAVVRAGDLVIDGSAKGRIDKLATTLAR